MLKFGLLLIFLQLTLQKFGVRGNEASSSEESTMHVGSAHSSNSTHLHATEEKNATRKFKDDFEIRSKIFNDLFKDYNPEIYPADTTLKLGISLVHIDLDELKKEFLVNGWFRYVWTDPRLTWDNDKVDVIRVPASKLWIPDVALYNAANSAKSGLTCMSSNALIYPNGEVLWVPPCEFSSICNITQDRNPMDPVTCPIKIGSWTMDGYTLDLQLYEPISLDLTDYYDINDKWKIVDSASSRAEAYYPCCEEPYVSLWFNVTLQRTKLKL